MGPGLIVLLLGLVICLVFAESENDNDVANDSNKLEKNKITLDEERVKRDAKKPEKKKLRFRSGRDKNRPKKKKGRPVKKRSKKNKDKKKPNKNKGRPGKKRNKRGKKKTTRKTKKNKKQAERRRLRLARRRQRKKLKKEQRTKNAEKQTQCRQNTVSDACMTTAMEVMTWEGNQVTNFLKQYKRYSNFQNQTKNKQGKRDKFLSVKTLMNNATANMTDVNCTYSTNKQTSKQNFEQAYKQIDNCSASILEACNMKNDTKMPTMIECEGEMSKVKKLNEACRETADAAGQCACWEKMAKDYMNPMKTKKCNIEMTRIIKAMKTEKNKCIAAFKACKKT